MFFWKFHPATPDIQARCLLLKHADAARFLILPEKQSCLIVAIENTGVATS